MFLYKGGRSGLFQKKRGKKKKTAGVSASGQGLPEKKKSSFLLSSGSETLARAAIGFTPLFWEQKQ